MSINNSNDINEFDNLDIAAKTKPITIKSNIERVINAPNITAKKYQKEIADRRKKVNNLLMKGYSQQEIMSKLHLSQSTVSRDIDFLYKLTKRNSINIGKVAFEELHKSILININSYISKGFSICNNLA
ncbi:MAG: helix-turn-helix domain-containing protein [Candidatus Nitrosocosmicus sp.]